MKVCEKVQRKGTTSYNEVADELVAEFSAADSHILPSESVSAPGRPPCRLSWVQRRPRNPGEAAPPPPVGAEEAPEPLGRTFLDPLVPGSCRIPVASVRSCGLCRGRPGSGGSVWPRVCPGSGAHVLLCTWSWAVWNPPRLCQAYDQKNIRRRVYDALNVLMAMNIISKEKKEIKWIGLPTNSAQECQSLEVPGCPGVLGGPGGAGHSRAAPGGDPGLEADGPGRVHSTSWPVGVLKNVVSTPRGGEAGRRWCSPETEEPPACLAAAASSGPLAPIRLRARVFGDHVLPWILKYASETNRDGFVLVFGL